MADLAERFLEDTEARRRARTASDYRRLVDRHILSEFGKLKLAELAASRIVDWHNARRSTPVEANRALSVLRRMLNLARTWGMLKGENPAKLVQMFRERARNRVASEAELAAIGRSIQYLNVPASVRRAIILLATTGARSSEVRNMVREDVDLSARTAVVRGTKNGEDRVLAIDAVAVASLDPAETSGYVCPALSDPKRPLSGATLHHWWRRILTEAKVDDLRPHDLRHGLATRAAQNNTSAPLLRDLLGHKSLAMANRYIGRVQDEAAAAQRRAGSAIGAVLVPEVVSGEVIDITEHAKSARRKA